MHLILTCGPPFIPRYVTKIISSHLPSNTSHMVLHLSEHSHLYLHQRVCLVGRIGTFYHLRKCLQHIVRGEFELRLVTIYINFTMIALTKSKTMVLVNKKVEKKRMAVFDFWNSVRNNMTARPFKKETSFYTFNTMAPKATPVKLLRLTEPQYGRFEGAEEMYVEISPM